MDIFCTLFDIRYVSRGLSLYHSLKRHSASFHLYIFAFCDESLALLQTLALTDVTLVSLEMFETPDLLAVKKERTSGEYCWTCTPFIIQHVLKHYRQPACTYVDADLYFYADPKPLLEEMGERSILLTEHRYTPKYDNTHLSGTYCVQFMCFKADPFGFKALDWWAQKCLEWCFARVEPGRFGDQKYLDGWPEKFQGVHVLEHLGGGVAPWNVQQYQIEKKGKSLEVVDKQGHRYALIFYHFHALQMLTNKRVDLGGHQLAPKVVEHIYQPYIQSLLAVEKQLKTLSSLDVHGLTDKHLNVLAKLRRKWVRAHPIYPLSRFDYG